MFKGQDTDKVLSHLDSLNIEFVAVPANMTHFFQPLDLTVNKSAKQFMKNEFITYYSNTVREGLEKATPLEDIEVDFRLTTMKPLHAQWLVKMFFHITKRHANNTQRLGEGWHSRTARWHYCDPTRRPFR